MSTSELENKPNGSGLKRIFKAAYCSLLGFKAAFKHESAFRQELLLIAVLLPVAWFTSETVSQLIVLFAVLILVLIVELLNSAIEAVVDRISLERHELSGRAKDLASAAVFLSLTLATVVWAVHLYNYIWN
jgi:diacylglycerol kinase (ATP)